MKIESHRRVGRTAAPKAGTKSTAKTTPPVENPQARVDLSAEAKAAQRKPGQALKQAGGDRLQAVQTLVKSGAKAENPKLNIFKDIARKLFGGTTTKTKHISPQQSINTSVKNRNFKLKRLRLTTRDQAPGADQVLRHVDLHPQTPGGGRAQVKDIGTVIAKGEAKNILEQRVNHPKDGQQGEIKNNFFDPVSGRNYLRTYESADRLFTDKAGTVKSGEGANTYRQIDVVNNRGDASQRYVFDYAKKNFVFQNLNSEGEVTNSYNISQKTNYHDLVRKLAETRGITPEPAPVQLTDPSDVFRRAK